MRSAYVSAICTLISVPAGTLAALAFMRGTRRRRGALQVYLLLPFTIASVVSNRQGAPFRPLRGLRRARQRCLRDAPARLSQGVGRPPGVLVKLAYPSFSLAGRRALVTGAGRGLGRGFAQGLAQAGADVAVAARSEGELAETAAAIAALGRRSVSLPLDVTDLDLVRRQVFAARERFGGLDILVSNAGVEQACPSLDVDEVLWDRVVDTNLKGAFCLCAGGRPDHDRRRRRQHRQCLLTDFRSGGFRPRPIARARRGCAA